MSEIQTYSVIDGLLWYSLNIAQFIKGRVELTLEYVHNLIRETRTRKPLTKPSSSVQSAFIRLFGSLEGYFTGSFRDSFRGHFRAV